MAFYLLIFGYNTRLEQRLAYDTPIAMAGRVIMANFDKTNCVS
jgi:hypothetical protein